MNTYKLPAGSTVLEVAEQQYEWAVAVWRVPSGQLVVEVTYNADLSTLAYWQMGGAVSSLSSKYGFKTGRVHATYHNGPEILGLPEETQVISFYFVLEPDRSSNNTGEIPRVRAGV